MARPRVAIVGTRNISPYGRAATEQLTNDLVKAGCVIVSGLALGTDSVAHRACLRAGGQTIAVLPSGIDRVYPAAHAMLAAEICSKGGALITEYSDGTSPQKFQFIARNRLIAALADFVLIPEAPVKSGCLYTSGFALELGLPVGAVPGPITSATSAGANNLIRTGAMLVSSADDILEIVCTARTQSQRSLPIGSNQQEQTIIDLMASGISEGSELLSQSALGAAVYMQTMTMLEVQGIIAPTGADHWALR
jgi:DNA processing protein